MDTAESMEVTLSQVLCRADAIVEITDNCSTTVQVHAQVGLTFSRAERSSHSNSPDARFKELLPRIPPTFKSHID
jgi:hypothetical protein